MSLFIPARPMFHTVPMVRSVVPAAPVRPLVALRPVALRPAAPTAPRFLSLVPTVVKPLMRTFPLLPAPQPWFAAIWRR